MFPFGVRNELKRKMTKICSNHWNITPIFRNESRRQQKCAAVYFEINGSGFNSSSLPHFLSLRSSINRRIYSDICFVFICLNGCYIFEIRAFTLSGHRRGNTGAFVTGKYTLFSFFFFFCVPGHARFVVSYVKRQSPESSAVSPPVHRGSSKHPPD